MKEHRIKKQPVQRNEAGYSLCSLLKRKNYERRKATLNLAPPPPPDHVFHSSLETNENLLSSFDFLQPKEVPPIYCSFDNSLYNYSSCFHPRWKNKCCCPSLADKHNLPCTKEINYDPHKLPFDELFHLLHNNLVNFPDCILESEHHQLCPFRKESIFAVGKKLIADLSFAQMHQFVLALFHQKRCFIEPNYKDEDNRSWLSYAFGCADDDALQVIRILLNVGACIWGTSENNSPFTLFLKMIIRRGSLDLQKCGETLDLLCAEMSNDPSRMHQTVMHSMFFNAQNFKILGPVFYEIKKRMMPYWTSPLELKHLARLKLRNNLKQSLKFLNDENLVQLGLPKTLREYLLLN